MDQYTKIASMEHFDQNESNGCAAKKYIIEFTAKVNSDVLWKILDKALFDYQLNLESSVSNEVIK